MNINKKIKSNLDLIYKKINYNTKKKTYYKGCLDKNFVNKKKNFSSPPFQYISVNYFYFSKSLNKSIKKRIKDEIIFLLRLQNKDGSYDEWYKNERSFCTSSYSSFLISNMLLNNNEIDKKFKDDIENSLEKSFYYLKDKFNENILNQNLAKLIFLQNYIKIVKNRKKSVQDELTSHLNKVHKFVLNSYEHEYKGVDLGYLSVSLMLSAEILKKNNSIKSKEIFLRLFYIAKNLTSDFNYFPNYIFSRSSRVFLISGFYFALKQNLININKFKNIYSFYIKNFEIFYKIKNIRYLSFFYSTDISLLLLNKSKKIFKKKNTKNNSEIISDYLFFKNKNKNLFIYKKNPNLIAFLINGKIKIHLCDTLVFNNNKYVSTILENIHYSKNKIFTKQKFSKITNLKKIAFRYLIVISMFSKIRIFNNFINGLAKYLLITRRKILKNFKKYRTVIIKKNKILIKEIIISNKTNYLTTSSDEVHYFSPTSFLLKNEIMKIKKISVNRFYKMNKKITSKIYEY